MTEDEIRAASLQYWRKISGINKPSRANEAAFLAAVDQRDDPGRAREAATLLEQGLSIADAVYHAGYADQPHLTRSLKRFIGQTPGQILDTGKFE